MKLGNKFDIGVSLEEKQQAAQALNASSVFLKKYLCKCSAKLTLT